MEDAKSKQALMRLSFIGPVEKDKKFTLFRYTVEISPFI